MPAQRIINTRQNLDPPSPQRNNRQSQNGFSTRQSNVIPSDSFADVLAGMSEEDIGERHNDWTRPDLPESEDKRSITFQNVDIRASNRPSGHSEIHLFGVTKASHSILVRVVGFRYHFWYPAPSGIREDDLLQLCENCNDYLDMAVVYKIELDKQSIKPDGELHTFLKISLSDHRQMKRVKNDSGQCDLFSSPELGYETTVPYCLRFILDTEIKAMTWLRIPSEKYKVIDPEAAVSCCQIEVAVSTRNLLICHTVDDREKFAPLRILSFDLECDIPSDNSFPQARNQAVLQIGNMVSVYGADIPFIRTIFTLDTCSAIAGAQVFSFRDESQMLMAWRQFFTEVDPDLVIGYNIVRFDIPFLLNRAHTLQLHDFPFFGRIKGSCQRLPRHHVSLSSFDECPGYDGRLIVDLLQHTMENHRGLPSYKLGNIATHLLGDTKEDLDYKKIPVLQRGDANDRREIALYCLKDVYLVLCLLAKLDCFEIETRKAKETHIPFNTLRTWPLLKDIAKRHYVAFDQGFLIADTT